MNEKKEGKNCYQIWGSKSGASTEDVREAYQKICLRFQSGNQNSDEETEFFELATRAFDVLVNPELRNQYDKSVIEDPYEFMTRLEEGTIDISHDSNGNGDSKDVPLVNGISEPSRRVRKGTLTGMGGKGKLSSSAMPRSEYTEATGGDGPRRRKTTSGATSARSSRARRPTLDVPRGAASELFTEDEQKVPMDYLLLFLAIGVPLLTLIWAFWVVLSG